MSNRMCDCGMKIILNKTSPVGITFCPSCQRIIKKNCVSCKTKCDERGGYSKVCDNYEPLSNKGMSLVSYSGENK